MGKEWRKLFGTAHDKSRNIECTIVYFKFLQDLHVCTTIVALQNENSRFACMIAVFFCCSEKSVMESVVDFISDVVPQVRFHRV